MDRRTVTEQQAANWNHRKQGARPMTERESAEWDQARKQGDRPTLLRIKRLCAYGK